MRPRGACALFLLLPLLVASPAQLGAQVSVQLTVLRLPAGAQDTSHAPLERYGTRLCFQRVARDPRPLDAPRAAPDRCSRCARVRGGQGCREVSRDLKRTVVSPGFP